MDIEVLIKSRAHRILRKRALFQSAPLDPSVFKPDLYPSVPAEEFIGIYQNSPDEASENIVITLKGIYIHRDGWRLLSYSDMQKVRVPLNKEVDNSTAKRTADTLSIDLKSGENINVLVEGGTDRTREIWEVYRFMMRVVSDVNKPRE